MSFPANLTGLIPWVRRRPVFKAGLRMLLGEAGGSAHVQGRAVLGIDNLPLGGQLCAGPEVPWW